MRNTKRQRQRLVSADEIMGFGEQWNGKYG